ncbi:hypothetical protein IV203_031592 [Nitzschia inconspicua]|uniref:Uncharacterized protein n=1 Tax=Nitzschia inconspicua TaxID=303405 RepID=A0A9K3Q578_9STRA|nr:hypothetical protein IV203_031592 [Nitzschia inconspicua]
MNLTDITTALKNTVQVLGLSRYNITLADISSHLGGVPAHTIKILGRWSSDTILKAFVEHDRYYPEPPDDGHTPAFRLEDIRNIAAIRHPGFAFSPQAHPTEHINFYIHSISSHDITPEEHALGNLTRRKLKTLTTLDKRHSAEHKQLDQIASLVMFGEPGLIGNINFDAMVNAVPATAAMVPAARLLLYMPWPQPIS